MLSSLVLAYYNVMLHPSEEISDSKKVVSCVCVCVCVLMRQQRWLNFLSQILLPEFS